MQLRTIGYGIIWAIALTLPVTVFGLDSTVDRVVVPHQGAATDRQHLLDQLVGHSALIIEGVVVSSQTRNMPRTHGTEQALGPIVTDVMVRIVDHHWGAEQPTTVTVTILGGCIDHASRQLCAPPLVQRQFHTGERAIFFLRPLDPRGWTLAHVTQGMQRLFLGRMLSLRQGRRELQQAIARHIPLRGRP